MPRNATNESPGPAEKTDSLTEIREGNGRMWAAWRLGKEVQEALSERADYGAMKEMSCDNASEAEKLRTYRAMARRVSEKELSDICAMCEKHGKKWGPTFIVALARITKATDRRRVAESVIRKRLGLREVNRQIRIAIARKDVRNVTSSAAEPAKQNRKKATRVGRKRGLDWTSEAEIMDEIREMCLTWERFQEDLMANTGDDPPGGTKMVSDKVLRMLGETMKQIHALRKQMERSRM